MRQPMECGSDACDAQSSSRVISGLSLPLALELVDNQDSMNVDELCEHLTQIAKQSCVVWRQVATAEEDF
ncbi:sorbose-specific PTS system EIIA component [Escherichia coli]|uniref:Sorbose-specific PTS system EIIA component n=1 Tax=Escherichia coli TaxID=562 RepID=A0A376MN58_ECOLX|nr:sorbose-specific PTS system EIIA component [Escherichia coli]